MYYEIYKLHTEGWLYVLSKELLKWEPVYIDSYIIHTYQEHVMHRKSYNLPSYRRFIWRRSIVVEVLSGCDCDGWGVVVHAAGGD